ncbi:MAG: hypothetical protein LBK40_08985 [Spirochaetaceae bacterium]|jgi:hypothetical protein|nr:hypothetical protein [Spirochaetaceae bacterium]
MEPVQDLAWRAQTALGTLERFELNQWSVTAVGLEKALPSRQDTLFSQKAPARRKKEPPLFATCRFRLLFFPKGGSEPVYTINMETSILGDWVLAEQEGKNRHIIGHIPSPLHYGEFRIRALEHAVTRLEELGRHTP